MTYAAIFVEVVKQIKIVANPSPPPPSEETKESDAVPDPIPEIEDDLLVETAAPYDSVLYFLWTFHHLQKETKAPNMVTL